MSKQKWNIIRIGLGDYATSIKGPLYKEILDCAKQNKVISASAFKSVDGFQIKGTPEVVRLFGGIEKSQVLMIEALIKFENKETFLTSLREICNKVDDPVIISVVNSGIEVYGIE